MAKIKKPTERQYDRKAVSLAMASCPLIYPCADCGWPVLSGYVCTTCGSNNPRVPSASEAS